MKKLITTLNDEKYKIEFDKNYTIYVIENYEDNNHSFFASIFNILLVEILNRDLNNLRITINDFLSRNNKILFLDNYEVTQDRIEEIKISLTGYSLSKEELFWVTILTIKGFQNSSIFFINGNIDIVSISNELNIPFAEFKQIENLINYEIISQYDNIKPLAKLFEYLDISIEIFNNNSNLKIDFRQYYNSQIEGLKLKFKPLFVSKIYNYLSSKDILEKSKFQDLVDAYKNETIYTVSINDINISVVELYLLGMYSKYPFLKIDIQELESIIVDTSLSKFRKNKKSFEQIISSKKDYEKFLDNFLELNTNRSLFYFDDTSLKLLELFNVFYDNSINQQSEISNLLDLSQYINNNNTTILQMQTSNIGNVSNFRNQGNGILGSRVDGSKQNSKNILTGLVGEKLVYELLKQKFSSTEWISKNAAKAGVNPEGSDSFGCDITFIDENNKIQYIEVKSNSDNQNHFFITYTEYCMAIDKKEGYQIIIVKNTLNNESREICNIGNIFQLNGDSDIFNNEKFTANFKTIEINYK